eukprot:TRINITY_DN28462_c0_g1_i3.p1 TRINITY_DN28462_c0_g1~~TRINITY_DN28462_c0_g1_i3.p1  ORF type:complete len:316 (-),score=60.93 TRINITY_DN28462_c0_g1_i3:15-962(-)
MSQEKRFLRVLGQSSKTNEWLRPQFVEKTYIFNPPRWLKLGFSVAAKFMSKQAVAKMWVHPNAGAPPASAGASSVPLCPYAQQLLGENLAFPACLNDGCFVLPEEDDSGKRVRPKALTTLPLPSQPLQSPEDTGDRGGQASSLEGLLTRENSGSSSEDSNCSWTTAAEYIGDALHAESLAKLAGCMHSCMLPTADGATASLCTRSDAGLIEDSSEGTTFQTFSEISSSDRGRLLQPMVSPAGSAISLWNSPTAVRMEGRSLRPEHRNPWRCSRCQICFRSVCWRLKRFLSFTEESCSREDGSCEATATPWPLLEE